MINNFLESIYGEVKKKFKYAYKFYNEKCLMDLLMLKYYCDVNLIEYKEIIDKENISIEYFIDDVKIILKNVKYTHLLLLVQYVDLKEIVREILNKEVSVLENNALKKLCLATELKREIYDMGGNTTYIIDEIDLSRSQVIFKFFDKVLNLNNKYMSYKESLQYNYDYMYIYDNSPKYKYIKNDKFNIFSSILRVLTEKKDIKVVLYSSYKKISNIRDARLILKYLSKVILCDDNVYLYFCMKDSENISIINYDKDKIKNLEQLKKIIDSDRKKRDVLIKITEKDIIQNHFRLGFNLYQTSKIDSIRNINEIVDENTSLIKSLTDINIKIEEEINKLINK